MQIENMQILSKSFSGENILGDIKLFLGGLKKKNGDKSGFHLVHALVFSKDMTESEIFTINQGLGSIYRATGFDVLGGDTSSGKELCVFISTIVF
ncbi:MAG: hypothetical protein WC635_12655 [Bacteriovorax sp.]|jgi:hypothetical protein